MSKATRRKSPQSQAPTVSPEIAALENQLRLARAQNAYLHRELATALKQGPLAQGPATGSLEELAAENADLRRRLGVLTTHYQDLERRLAIEEERVRIRDRNFKRLLQSVTGQPGSQSRSLFEEPLDLSGLLTKLLTIAHPDKWAQGQPATELAHEMTLTINAIRENLEVAS